MGDDFYDELWLIFRQNMVHIGYYNPKCIRREYAKNRCSKEA